LQWKKEDVPNIISGKRILSGIIVMDIVVRNRNKRILAWENEKKRIESIEELLREEERRSEEFAQVEEEDILILEEIREEEFISIRREEEKTRIKEEDTLALAEEIIEAELFEEKAFQMRLSI
jgi:hypothetical protein